MHCGLESVGLIVHIAHTTGHRDSIRNPPSVSMSFRPNVPRSQSALRHNVTMGQTGFGRDELGVDVVHG